MAASAADAIGLNFFAGSVRYLDPDAAETSALSKQAAAANLIRVGVFVNEPVARITQIAADVGLEHVQLHGDEPLTTANDLVANGLSVIRAVKLPKGRIEVGEIERRTEQWLTAGVALLLDADAGAAHGGSGQTLEWESIQAWSQSAKTTPWVLAGGLSVENVSEAVRVSGAVAVDVASGVERPRGTKSAALIEQFAGLADRALPPKEPISP